ncbi:RNA methyltransferase [Telmatocola sphagniphila]|uniref:RNA methyltransferase n=1 Tax=Telmatocola sphagniphila TaxID=1123043 RepID=A0A8E6BA28_9BACT|nr:THUMP domain-containing protein [Telmatocola sphagniphila]QVL33333.1 RNA methyltransferase [Telmatocola sphagniphila]
MTSFFATCARGFEPFLARELEKIAASDIQPGRGGVHFQGNRRVLYKSNLHLRTAVRVLQPLRTFPVQSTDELYQAAQTIDWEKYLTLEHTFAIDCNVRDSAITHSLFAAQRVKDAICDQFIARCGKRPSVNLREPMVQFNLHIFRNEASISLDSSCESLHKRGYRPIQTIAPLNEALAAALILQTGWKPDEPFCDPMCGSATLPIEASWMALNRAPGLTRKHFGFMGWLDYDKGEWANVRDEARNDLKKALLAPIIGYDERVDVIELASKNANAAGVGHLVELRAQGLYKFVPSEGKPGTILMNPPYGERIGEEEDLIELYQQIGKIIKTRCTGWKCWIFTGNRNLLRATKLKVLEKHQFMNGKIDCQLARVL